MSQAWLNGKFVEEDAAAVSIRDTGLLHAAGVFTTLRSYSGKIFRLDHHLARLRHSCESLFIPLQYKDETLTAVAAELLNRNGLGDARLRLTVTRGSARQDPVHGLRLEPEFFLTATDMQPYPAELYQRGMTAILLDEQKLNPYDIQAGHKTLNYFSRLSALRDANARGAGEAIWFNVHNFLQSGSISNIFLVPAAGDVLLTPPTLQDLRDPAVAAACPYPRSAVLPGIARAAVIELARSAGIEVRFAAVDVNQLLEAREVFLTNSIMQIMPVCRLERRVIGDDRPGPLTHKLAEAYDRLVAA